jgi:hypothetical protein
MDRPPLLDQMIELSIWGETTLPWNDALECQRYGAGQPVRVRMMELNPNESYFIGGPPEVGFRAMSLSALPAVNLFHHEEPRPKPISYDTHVYRMRKWAFPRVGHGLTPWDYRERPYGWVSNGYYFHHTFERWK